MASEVETRAWAEHASPLRRLCNRLLLLALPLAVLVALLPFFLIERIPVRTEGASSERVYIYYVGGEPCIWVEASDDLTGWGCVVAQGRRRYLCGALGVNHQWEDDCVDLGVIPWAESHY